MPLTKETVQDKVTVDEYCNVHVREATRIIEDGVVIGKSFHRRVITPISDLTLEPDGTAKTIATNLHTPECKAEYIQRTQNV